MPVNGLDHINIRTMDVAVSARFYADILDLEFRQGPVIMGQQANWLYDDAGCPIIHFRIMEAGSTSTGGIDHVALSCSGRQQIAERLKARNIQFAVAENLMPGITQMFFEDPHGIRLELQFKDE